MRATAITCRSSVLRCPVVIPQWLSAFGLGSITGTWAEDQQASKRDAIAEQSICFVSFAIGLLHVAPWCHCTVPMARAATTIWGHNYIILPIPTISGPCPRRRPFDGILGTGQCDDEFGSRNGFDVLLLLWAFLGFSLPAALLPEWSANFLIAFYGCGWLCNGRNWQRTHRQRRRCKFINRKFWWNVSFKLSRLAMLGPLHGDKGRQRHPFCVHER